MLYCINCETEKKGIHPILMMVSSISLNTLSNIMLLTLTLESQNGDKNMNLSTHYIESIKQNVEALKYHKPGRLEISHIRRKGFAKLILRAQRVFSIFPLSPELI